MTDGSYRQELAAWGRAVGLTADGAKIDGGGRATGRRTDAVSEDVAPSVDLTGAPPTVAPREGER